MLSNQVGSLGESFVALDGDSGSKTNAALEIQLLDTN